MRVTKLVRSSAVILGGAMLLAIASRARDLNAASLSNELCFATQLKVEEVPGLPSITRAFVTLGTNKFAFLVPRDFRLDSSPEHLAISSQDYVSLISIRFRPPVPDGTAVEKKAYYRGQILGDHPGGKILQEFSRTAAGRSGPAFDLQFKQTGGSIRDTRVAFIPFASGVLEFNLTTNPDRFHRATFKFNNLLLSFRTAQGGQLDTVPLSNKF